MGIGVLSVAPFKQLTTTSALSAMMSLCLLFSSAHRYRERISPVRILSKASRPRKKKTCMIGARSRAKDARRTCQGTDFLLHLEGAATCSRQRPRRFARSDRASRHPALSISSPSPRPPPHPASSPPPPRDARITLPPAPCRPKGATAAASEAWRLTRGATCRWEAPPCRRWRLRRWPRRPATPCFR